MSWWVRSPGKAAVFPPIAAAAVVGFEYYSAGEQRQTAIAMIGFRAAMNVTNGRS